MHAGKVAWVAAVALAPWAGCGLADLANIGGVTFDMPAQMYAVSSADAQWQGPATDALPALACATAGDCCGDPTTLQAAGIDCTANPLSCLSGQCAYLLPYQKAQVIDLAKAIPQIKQGQTVSNVILKSIDYTVMNHLNIALPPVDVFVAPAQATSSADPNAVKIATLAGVAAGVTLQASVPLDATAQTAFSQRARQVSVPFAIIMTTIVPFVAGQPTPVGEADFTLGGKVEARF